MFTRFIFGKTGSKGRKDQEVHPYGLFLDPLSLTDGNLSELKWKAHLKVDQARLIAKSKDAKVNMVALVPRSSYALPQPSFSLKHDYDESLLPWDHLPRSFDLNFSAVDQDTGDVLPQFSFPYFSSHFQSKSQLLQLETRLDPFSNARSYNFSDYFRYPKELPLDFYSPADIQDLLHFIPGIEFNSKEHDSTVRPAGFFLLHVVSARMLVPVSYTLVSDLLCQGLPGDPSLWSTILTNMEDFSALLQEYYKHNFSTFKAPTLLTLQTLLPPTCSGLSILKMTTSMLLTPKVSIT